MPPDHDPPMPPEPKADRSEIWKGLFDGTSIWLAAGGALPFVVKLAEELRGGKLMDEVPYWATWLFALLMFGVVAVRRIYALEDSRIPSLKIDLARVADEQPLPGGQVHRLWRFVVQNLSDTQPATNARVLVMDSRPDQLQREHRLGAMGPTPGRGIENQRTIAPRGRASFDFAWENVEQNGDRTPGFVIAYAPGVTRGSTTRRPCLVAVQAEADNCRPVSLRVLLYENPHGELSARLASDEYAQEVWCSEASSEHPQTSAGAE